MEKKNPYIMTIGFKKEDPDHVYVAELLNSMGRGKAQYIVKAILAYQGLQKRGELPPSARMSVDYDIIRQIVMQIMDEREGKTSHSTVSMADTVQEPEQGEEKDVLEGFDEAALNGIMESIAAFQEQ